MATHYEVLGVPRSATPQQIHRAYLEAARRHHPDKHAGSDPDVLARAREEMASVNAAWDALRDSARRQAYDQLLGDARRDFSPLDAAPPTVEDEEPKWTDEPAWAGNPDTDDTPPGLSTQSVVLVPVGLLACAGATLAFAMMSQIAALLAVAVVLVALAGVGFVAAPLLMIRRRTGRGSLRDPRS